MFLLALFCSRVGLARHAESQLHRLVSSPLLTPCWILACCLTSRLSTLGVGVCANTVDAAMIDYGCGPDHHSGPFDETRLTSSASSGHGPNGALIARVPSLLFSTHIACAPDASTSIWAPTLGEGEPAQQRRAGDRCQNRFRTSHLLWHHRSST